jgi:hypothetical protein
MAAATAQARVLAPLVTEDNPSPTSDEIVTPPPAYCPPPEGFRFYRSPSWEGAYNAHQTHLNPETEALQKQYTEYFEKLFIQWAEYAKHFWNYGIPAIKWSCLFFVIGFGGWRENLLKLGWFAVWYVPTLIFTFVANDVVAIANDQSPQAKMNAHREKLRKASPFLDKVLYVVSFWGTYTAILLTKFGSLWYITRMGNWTWPAWGLWVLIFGI